MGQSRTPVSLRFTAVGTALTAVALLVHLDRRLPSPWSWCILGVAVLCDLAALVARWKAAKS